MVTATASAVVAVTCVGAILTHLQAHETSTSWQLTQVLIVVGSALFLCAGALRFARGRITDEPRSLLMGTALVVLGGLGLPLTSLASALVGRSTTALLPSLTAVVTTLVTLALVVRALGTPADDPSLAPVSLLVKTLLTTLGTFLVLVAAHFWLPGGLASTSVSRPAFQGALLGVAWFTVALAAATRSDDVLWARRVAPLLGCMAVAELMRVFSALQPGAWELAGAVLVAVVSSITAHRALMDLDEAIHLERERIAAIDRALQDTKVDNGAHRAWREEFAHDAKNTLAGLRAALLTLHKYGGALDESTIERLRSAALGELGHLEHLIIRSDRDDNVDFDLCPVLGTVVDARRAAGLDVTYSGPDVRAHGRPGDVATALQNVLVNAEEHARGPVQVTAAIRGDWTDITVTDSGPGLTAGQLATLFQRGARGPSSRGLGLGLHVARSLMRRQGGDLTASSGRGFSTFTLTLLRAGGDDPFEAVDIAGMRASERDQAGRLA